MKLPILKILEGVIIDSKIVFKQVMVQYMETLYFIEFLKLNIFQTIRLWKQKTQTRHLMLGRASSKVGR